MHIGDMIETEDLLPSYTYVERVGVATIIKANT